MLLKTCKWMSVESGKKLFINLKLFHRSAKAIGEWLAKQTAAGTDLMTSVDALLKANKLSGVPALMSMMVAVVGGGFLSMFL